MVRRVEQKKRGKLTRKRKKIIVIGTEGKNKTEKNYFGGFNRLHGECIVKFAKGNDTDPLKITKSVHDCVMKEQLSFDEGDRAFCVVDTDVDHVKQKKIDEAVQYGKWLDVDVILSNPCFEIWFLQHFNYSTRSFSSNDAVIKELKKYIPGYEKSSDVFEQLLPRAETAMQNAIRLEEHHNDVGHKVKSVDRNPSSEIHEIVKECILRKGIKEGDDR